jgi:hypothetical protein
MKAESAQRTGINYKGGFKELAAEVADLTVLLE